MQALEKDGRIKQLEAANPRALYDMERAQRKKAEKEMASYF